MCVHGVAKVPRILHEDHEDSDQTVWMTRLIPVFAGHTGYFVGFVMLQFIFIAKAEHV